MTWDCWGLNEMMHVKSLLVKTQKLSGVTLLLHLNRWTAFQSLQSAWISFYHLRVTAGKVLCPMLQVRQLRANQAKWSGQGHGGNSKAVLLSRLSDSKPRAPPGSHCLPDLHLRDPDCSATKKLETAIGIKSGPLVLTWPGVARAAANTQERRGGMPLPVHSPWRESSFLKDLSKERPSKNANLEYRN